MLTKDTSIGRSFSPFLSLSFRDERKRVACVSSIDSQLPYCPRWCSDVNTHRSCEVDRQSHKHTWSEGNITECDDPPSIGEERLSRRRFIPLQWEINFAREREAFRIKAYPKIIKVFFIVLDLLLNYAFKTIYRSHKISFLMHSCSPSKCMDIRIPTACFLIEDNKTHLKITDCDLLYARS